MASGTNTANKAAPPVVIPSGNNILMNPLQRGNPIIEHIRNVGKEYSEIVVDYQVGRTTGVLFLSLKYHRLHPEYIHTRIEKLGGSYSLRILLVLSDISEHKEPIRELTKICLINNITVIVAFSPQEAGHYLATFKQFEHKPPDMIKERVDKEYTPMLRSSLTSISKVNKTDVETLRNAFGSFAGIAQANTEQLQSLPGFGQVKVKNVETAFNKPFRNGATTSLKVLASQSQSQAARPTAVDKGKGKAKETDDVAMDESLTTRKNATPEWDELDLDLDSPPAPAPKPPEHRPRAESPVWDIELDLN